MDEIVVAFRSHEEDGRSLVVNAEANGRQKSQFNQEYVRAPGGRYVGRLEGSSVSR